MATKAAAAPPAAAPEVAPATDAAPVKKGKKKLIIMVAAAVLVMAAAGGAVAFYLKKKAAAAAAELAEAQGSDQTEVAAHPKVDLNHPPVFVPLEPFTVNLADKESDRYAQIAVTLQVEDIKFAEKMKAFMPAIRNSILMVLAHKTSQELLERSGKQALAEEIMREAARPMGIYVTEAAPAKPKVAQEAKDGGDESAKKAKPVAEPVANPIQQVHFANFIIQ